MVCPLLKYPAKKNTNEKAVGCFVAGTLVHTKEGLRPIQEIKVGDYVLSRPEDGSGETPYKRVVNTFEFEDKEAWFVSWENVSAYQRHRSNVTPEEYVENQGDSFVVTTPNQPFWVVSCEGLDDPLMHHYGYSSPYPERQWVRADRLAPGMTLLLADGRAVRVWHSERVYKTDKELQGWLNLDKDGSPGIGINFANQQVRPVAGLYDFLLKPDGNYWDGYVLNPNESYADDFPDEPAPHSWYRCKVYTLEVEGYHTYFVDKLGIWVHNTNCAETNLCACPKTIKSLIARRSLPTGFKTHLLRNF